MRIITVNLPISYLIAIKKLTGENGLYPSRSELIRVACREFLIKELEAAKSFAKFQQQTQFSAVYPLPVKEEIKESNKVEIPETDSEGKITGYTTYNIIPREEILSHN